MTASHPSSERPSKSTLPTAVTALRCWIPRAISSILIADERTFELPVGFSERLHARLEEEIEK